ncbi:Endoribonuclease Dicer-like protein 2b [Dichanthelium oligosanthes]|uniref:Endoribonuclease Dicer-like protein 2b n=1 Tax=Dichanthelium oligosanthes TaxID=888268 RepID=A0A1E5VA22_9POAL|nr:Endoribonuclease Dicer-like protein 2b [Dichanthelium oligosanthes]
MDGSASVSSSAAADVADTAGGEDSFESGEDTGNALRQLIPNFTHSAEDTYQHRQPVYFPEELLDNWVSFSRRGLYHCYNISLRGCFNTTTPPTDIILAVKCDMGPEFLRNSFNSGGVEVTIQYIRIIHLNQEQVNMEFITSPSFLISRILFLVSFINASFLSLRSPVLMMRRTRFLLLQVIFARRFQTTILSLLIGNGHSEVRDAIKYFHEPQVSLGVVYLLLPSVYGKIDWCGIKFSTSSVYDATDKGMRHCHSCKDADLLQTMDGPCCRCMLRNSVVYIPRDRKFYNTTGFLDLNANDPLHLRDRSADSSKRYGVCLTSESNPLLVASGLFTVPKFLHKCYEKGKEPSGRNAIKLPPELCRVVMAPVSTNTLCSFSYVPSMMFRIQCLLLSSKLKIQLGPRMQQFNITALKGYIHGEEFNLNKWIIPGLGYDRCGDTKSFFLPTNNMYSLKAISIKTKTIADTVEALIGAYLSASGEQAAFHFIKSLGMDVELHSEMPYERKIITKSEEIIDVRSLETMLGYVFNDRSLLIEALTHSSYNTAGPCYERLEFLGDAVLDHIITDYFYKLYYPGCTPALLTNLRKASVNNCCYAHAAVKAGLHKHMLHSSSKQMIDDLENSGRSFSGPSHGWEPGIGLPENLADLIESIAGAIYLDSKHKKEVVWRAMRRLLEPLATPKTVELSPVSELKETCERKKYPYPSYSPTRDDGVGVTRVVAGVKAAGTVYYEIGEGRNQKVAQLLAAKALLQKMKAASVA